MKPLPLLFALASCFAVQTARAQFPVFPAADRVLGASNFTTLGPNIASASSMDGPTGLAIDPVSGKLFIAVANHHRILRFANSAALANGASAEAVIGQPDYTTATSGTSSSTLNLPYGLHVDGSGRLWVADYSNHRVLRFDNAATLPEFGATADLVLGQADFVSGTASVSATRMNGPTGVYVDAADNLWVAEYENNRVLKFANASSLVNGAAATTVLGQPDFDTATSGASQVKMKGAVAVRVDDAGRLWVAEEQNHRLLRFDGAAGLGNGAAANAVLGQPDFTTVTAGSTAVKMSQPSAFAIDAAGTLYVSDFSNSRVLYFKNPAAKANGAPADGVIGQPDLTTVTSGTTANKLDRPYGGLDFDAAGNLWVTDFDNERSLRFSPDRSAAPPKVTGKVPKSVSGGKVTIKGTAVDAGGVAQIRYRVGKGAFQTAVGTTAWTFKAKLKPGKNTIEIVVVDAFGNVSPAKRVKVTRE